MKKISLSGLLPVFGFAAMAQTAPPVVSGLSVATAIPGSSVTISGSGFNSTAVNNIVYFGDTKATVTSASATSLTVTVPFGATYSQVSVNNAGTGLTGLSQAPFLPTFNAGPYTPAINLGSYKDIQIFDPGYWGGQSRSWNGAISGDIDGDGSADIIVSSYYNDIYVIRNNSQPGGQFVQDSNVSLAIHLPASFKGVALGDIDGDGKKDIVVAADSLYVIRNTSTSGTIGAGSFAAPVGFASGGGRAVAVSDIDMDGKADVIVGGASLSLFRNTSTAGAINSGSLSSYVSYATSTYYGTDKLVVGDIDGDSKPDIVSLPEMFVFRNTSTSGGFDTNTFAPPVDLRAIAFPSLYYGCSGAVLSDLNGDGKRDMAFMTDDGYTYIIENKATVGSITDTSFRAPVEMSFADPSLSSAVGCIAVADMDGDSKPDLLTQTFLPGGYSYMVGSNLVGTIAVFRNLSTGGGLTGSSFATPTTFHGEELSRYAGAAEVGTSIPGSTRMVVGDFDGDTRPDVLLSSSGLDGPFWSVTVIQSQAAPPAITSISAVSANPGSSLTIGGVNFDTNPTNNLVYFGATKANVTSASGTSLTVTVPVGATFEPISVNNSVSGKTGYSSAQFLPKFDNSAFLPGSVNFDPKVEFPLAASIHNTATGDIDGDGKTDIVISKADSVYVYRNISTSGSITTSSFAAPVGFRADGPVGSSSTPLVTGVKLGDMDEDGKLDIVCEIGPGYGFTVLKNIATPGSIIASSFAPHVDFCFGPGGAFTETYLLSGVKDISLADYDGDGKLDVIGVSTSSGSPCIGVFRNLSVPGSITSSSFDQPETYGVSIWSFMEANPIIVADLNNDNKPEVIHFSNYGGMFSIIDVLKNKTQKGVITSRSTPGFPDDTSFAQVTSIVLDTLCKSIAIADIDGDGKKDIIATSLYEHSIEIMRNTTTGSSISFAPPVYFAASPVRDYSTSPTGGPLVGVREIACGDFDGDGKVDIVVSNTVDSSVSVYRNTATAGSITSSSLSPRKVFSTNRGPIELLVADFDGDGKSDIMTTAALYDAVGSPSNPGNVFSILRNNPAVIYGPSYVCIGSSASLLAGVAGGTWSSSNIGVATIASTGVVSAVAVGSATISYAYPGGLSTFVITVDTIPNPGTITGPVSICLPTPLYGETFTSSVPGGGWSSGNPAVATFGYYDSYSSPSVYGVSAGTAVISYTVGNGCNATATKTITVTTTAPDATVSGTSTVCAGSALSLSGATPGGTWSSSTPSVATVASGTGIVTGMTAGTTRITYTVGNGCGTSTTTKTVTVNATPETPTLDGPISLCVGASGTVTDTTMYVTWPGDGIWTSSNTSVVSFAVGEFDPPGGKVITGVSAGTATITHTVTLGGCSSFGTITVSVSAGTTVSPIAGTSVVCVGSTTSLSDTTAGGTWSSSDPFKASVSSFGVVSGVGAGTAMISYITSGGAGCSGYATKIVTVNALPNAGTITGAASLCISGTTTLSDAASGGVWSSGAISVATVNSSGLVSGISAGTVTISYTVTDGCGTATATKVVMVESSPSAGTIGGVATVCGGEMTTLSSTVGGGAWSGGATGIASVSGSGVVTAAATGTATISYTVSNSCGSSTATKIVTVNAGVGAITGLADLCNGSTSTLSNSTSGGVWSSAAPGTASIDAGGVVTGVSHGTTLISYSLTGCGTVATKVVSVHTTLVVPPISGPSTVCAGSTINVDNTSLFGTWTSSNPAVFSITNFGMPGGEVVTGIAAGTATITYSVTDMDEGYCTTTVTKPITVLPSTLPAIAGTAVVCAGGTTSLSNTTTGGSWTSGNMTIATVDGSGIVTGVAGGTAVISYAAATSCGSLTTTRIVTVNPLPGAGTITGSSTVNVGATITLSNAVSGGAWSSGAGSIATVNSSGVAAGVAAGSAIISYSVTNGCGTDVATKVITVNPAAEGTISGDLVVCAGSTSNLSNSLPGGIWSSSNTSRATVSTAGVVTGLTAGTVVISYNASGSVATAIVTVNTSPSVVGTASICIGTTVTLLGSAGGAWSSLDPAIASVGATGIVTGNAAGTTTIEYTLSNGCKVTRVATVNVNPEAIDGPTSVCVGATMTLTNSVSGGTWSSSNIWQASVGTAGNVTGVAVGTPVITYAIGVCKVTQTVNVLSSPAVVGGTAKVCPGTTATLTNATAGGVWSSSDPTLGTVSASGVVTGVAAGTVNILYTMTNGCSRSAIATINANPAEITGATSICAGATTSLSSATSGLQWSSSDASKATVNSVSGIVTGVAAGTAKITYKNTTTGCLTTTVVAVSASPASIGGTARACPGATTSLTNATTGGAWSSSDPTIATIGTNGVVSGLVSGTTTIEYSIGGGCSRSVVVTINSSPAVSGSLGVCLGKSTMLTSSPAASSWVSSNPAVATVGSGSVAGMTAGTADITVTVGTGCKAVVNVTVNPLPPAISGTLATCVGSTTTLSNAMSGGTWASYAPSFASINSSGVVTGLVVSNVMITYTSGAGCIRTGAFTVNATPTIAGTASICEGASTALSVGGSTSGTWSSSAAAQAVVGLTGIVTGVSAGNATISYTSPIGCQASRVVTVNVCPSRQAITGVGNFELNTQIMMFPNPTNGMLTIQTPEAGTLSVFAVDGKEVASYHIKEGETNIVLPKDLAAGVYMCRFNGNEGNSAMVRLIYQP